jgi:Uma2 family endonuclease
MPVQETLVSVEEYLNTSYEGPDREYLDGRIVERNLGEKDHSRPQRKLIVFFASLEKTLGTFAFPEQRVQVKATRFRVPDVCIYVGAEPDEQIFRTPPFVWIIDPRSQRAYTYSLENGFVMQPGLHTKNPDIELPPEKLFE